jgi:hypothetical protein
MDMTDETRGPSRRRTNDPDFLNQLADARKRFAELGVEEEGIDWEEVERETQRKLEWRKRLAPLGAPAFVVEVVVDTAKGIGKVVDSLGALYDTGGSEITVAAADRGPALALGKGGGHEEQANISTRSVSGSVIVNESGKVTVRLMKPSAPVRVVLVPSAPGLRPQERIITREQLDSPGEFLTLEFHLPTDFYALAVHPLEPEA